MKNHLLIGVLALLPVCGFGSEIQQAALATFDEKIPHRDRVAKLAADLYESNGGEPVWASNTDLKSVGDAIIAALEAEGLNPSFASPDPERLAKRLAQRADLPVPADDVAITLSVLHAGLRIRHGDVAANELWPHWNEGDTPGTVEDEGRIQQLLDGNRDVAGALALFRPRNWVYEALKREWTARNENADAEQNSFEPLPPLKDGQFIEAGEPYEHAELLGRLLKREGYFDGDVTGEVVPKKLAAALNAFQEDHSLASDGVLGPDSWEVLNQGPAEQLEMLRLNLQRARLLPDDLGNRHVVVNLPSGRVHGFDGKEANLEMRVVFGASSPGRRTPLFRDEMQFAVFRPYWNVPRSIAKNEIFPAAIKDRGYLARNGYELVTSYDWEAKKLRPNRKNLRAMRDGTYKVRQVPGDSNALGLVKFLFPNQHAVYLHDTPKDELFARSERDFSHGCIRLEDPAKFAEWVLGWDSGKVASALAGKDRNYVKLENPVPVYIVYFTVFPDPETGEVRRYFDVYDRDDNALTALDRATGDSES